MLQDFFDTGDAALSPADVGGKVRQTESFKCDNNMKGGESGSFSKVNTSRDLSYLVGQSRGNV